MNTLQPRIRISSALPLLLALSLLPACRTAAAIDNSVPDPQSLTRLELRAQQANPREQCFLYAELVHSMTELAGKQIHDGDDEQAAATLKKIDHYVGLIHLGLADDTKRLKNTEQLMEYTTYRMHAYMNSAPSEDRPVVKSTLTQLNRIEDEILAQLFKH